MNSVYEDDLTYGCAYACALSLNDKKLSDSIKDEKDVKELTSNEAKSKGETIEGKNLMNDKEKKFNSFINQDISIFSIDKSIKISSLPAGRETKVPSSET